MRKVFLLIIILLVASTAYADYGVETDHNVFFDEQGFTPSQIDLKEGDVIKFINLGPESKIQSSFFESSLIPHQEFVDVEMMKTGDAVFFLSSEPDKVFTAHVTLSGPPLVTGLKVWGAVNYSGGGEEEYNISELLELAHSKNGVSTVSSRLKDYLERHGLLEEKQETITPEQVKEQNEVTGSAVDDVPMAPPVDYVDDIDKDIATDNIKDPVDEAIQDPVEERMDEIAPVTQTEQNPPTVVSNIPIEPKTPTKLEPITEKEPKSSAFTIVLLLILLIAIGGGIVYFFVLKSKPKKHEHHHENPLTKYVRTYLHHGYSEETLHKHLKAHGHSDEDIHQALHHAKRPRH